MLGDFVTHSLLALDAKWLFQRGNIEPPLLLLALGHHAGTVADVAINQRDMGAICFALHAVGERNIFGHEDVGFNPGGSGVSGQGAGGITG